MRNAVLLLTLLSLVVLVGCDLGTYERRAAEPMSSKMESNAPVVSQQEGEQ